MLETVAAACILLTVLWAGCCESRPTQLRPRLCRLPGAPPLRCRHAGASFEAHQPGAGTHARPPSRRR
jgi:hypothetical protein